MVTGIKKNPNSIKWEILDFDVTKGAIVNIVPPLIMDINPSELTISYKQIKNVVRTFGGFVEEHWPEELDSISSSGVTAMFYTDKKDSYNSPGLTVLDRRNSEAYSNFQTLINIYRNNGKVYDTKAHTIKRIAKVRMHYNDKVYEGHFENFGVKEKAENLFVIEYDFEFSVHKTFGDYIVGKAFSLTEFLRQGESL